MKSCREFFLFGPVIFASDSEGHIDTVIQVTVPDVVRKVISGERRGLSPDVKIERWECSICHEDYEECLHEEGKKYGGALCRALPKDIEFFGASLVARPKDPRARVTDLLVIEKNHMEKFTWYGFPVEAENQRFKHIQRALKSGLIPEKAALHFGQYFSVNLEGKAIYP